MHGLTLLQDLAVVMIVAGLVTILFHRFKQPVVLGYILAGFIIGPHSPPFSFVHDEESIKTLSEIGVILLMFSLGLEFSLRKLKTVGGTAFIAAFLEIALMIWAGYEVGRLFGWRAMDSLFLGAMLSISSTTIIVKALAELGKSKERFAELIFGILIIEDMLAIVMLALLSGIAMTGTLSLRDVGVTVGKLGTFLVAALVLGLLAVPRLLGYIARFKSNEMLLVAVLGLCFGFSLLAAKLGFSVALGAFLIGAVIAEARDLRRIEILVEPVRDMFSAVFFVAIGLLIEPALLAEYWLPIIVISLAVVLGKVVTCSFGTFIAGNDSRTSLRVGMGLAQIGEFSFIIASLGLTLNVTSKFLYPVAVAVSAITTLLTPYLIKSADAAVAAFDRLAPRSLAHSLELYTQWAGQIGSGRHGNLAGKLTRRWLAQMALNIVLITAVFIAAVFVDAHQPKSLATLGLGEEFLKIVLFLIAAFLSLPMFIATSRKLQALGLLIAETRVSRVSAGKHTDSIRSIVAQVIPITGTAILGIYVVMLASTLLTTVKMFLALLMLATLIAWSMRRSFVRVYSKAQIALESTFAQPPPSHHEPVSQLPGMLKESNLQLVHISESARACGKRIRELQLRTKTGASIVGIERGGANIINPEPDEELQAGDHVLLLGKPSALKEAVKTMQSAGIPPE